MTAVKSCGNVFADLGFDAQEAANLKLRSQRIRLDRESGANHDLNRLLDKSGMGVWNDP